MAIDESITIKKLEVFLAFMKLNNMARVSELLGQSTVSVHRSLHSLEEAMRCPLFKREGRSLIPLQSAYTFAEYAQRVINEVEEGIRKVQEAAGFNATRLKIGSLYSLTLRCIPQLMIGLKLRKPALDIDLTLGSNRDLIQQLADGRLDAIVIGLHEQSDLNNPDDSQALVAVPLFDDDVFLAAPLHSPYAGQKRVNLQDLRDEKFVTLTEGFVTSQDFAACFERAGFTPNISMRVQDIFSLINLVSGGIGYSLLPGRVGKFSSHIQLIALESKYGARQRITLLLPKSRERDPNLLALAAECRMYGRHDGKSEGFF
ncbi:LysR family transcriptional regulator [Glaciimonas sp. CA11.2]|uniref:LysR family transcriptional regulator n=1 Tax=unclassified Glaciimonas TaxID=2644401 RepID=UPI002AB528D4|nr:MULTISPECIES: LysR family transcriptional regulator [unclassified Glaciimonas]MDY7547978.1 LysR family transcriptional regulator [Glaciimonas sp. CA11.2]MEB0010150.1 LysR family transcriptional regulator [Glaciimonas sp. Cout2]MEB0084175.1 LysR family transcriptional regulator [Glaciimonas sp. Gout2]MEB0164524.1 LysR family transcriptional regulator [Glaciimonas sp. CA11.2]